MAVTGVGLSEDERIRLRRAHQRLRTASKDLEALTATSPVRGRWEPERAPPGILRAVRAELAQAYAGLGACQAEILGWTDGRGAIEVLERDRAISFSYEDMMRYAGSGSPGGVAHAFKVMERGFPLLDPGGPPQRQEIAVTTAFAGPGARDGFEVVIRAVTGGRYVVDSALARPGLGSARERFVFRLNYGAADVTLSLRDGFVTDEFIALTRQERSVQDDARLDLLKAEMADRVMASRAADVYDATPGA